VEFNEHLNGTVTGAGALIVATSDEEIAGENYQSEVCRKSIERKK